MLTVAAQHCGVDPSFAIGGDLNEAGSNAHHGSGDLFIVEADESDGSFLVYQPHAAIVTNVEADHLDHYGTAAAVDRQPSGTLWTVDGVGLRRDLRRRPRRAAARRARARRASTCGPTARPGRRPAARPAHDQRLDQPATSRCCAASRLGRVRLGSPAGTWPGTSAAALLADRASGWACRRPCWSRGLPASPVCGGAWSSRARPEGCASTTTTPTTRPRSRPSSSRPAT